MKRTVVFLLLIWAALSHAQDTASGHTPLTFSGYAEVYYLYDFGKPSNHTRPPFVYSHNRTGEVALNLGYMKASYNNGVVRANLALMTGTYADANLASESGALKNIYEANVGVKLSRSKNLWLDAGVLPSHIGFERR